MEKPAEAAVQMLRRVMQAGHILAQSAKSQRANAEQPASTTQPTAALTETTTQAINAPGNEK
ncbi:MAG: hypothetical protein ACYDBJ_10675 [Aggregatilineales bacterium]